MRVLQINIFGNLSTGRIAVDIYKTLKSLGHDGMIAFARGQIEEGIPHIKIGSDFDVKVHGFMTRVTDKTGFYSKRATSKLIAEIREYNPDIIHLHNLHGYYLNVEILFNFLKEYKKPVVWTLHDCWAFTGHCAYFDYAQCERWITGCYNCIQKKEYPASKIRDGSKENWERKKELFTGIEMTIVTPSKWLANLVRQSFLKEHEIVTIHNGIDLDVFKTTKSKFREKYDLQEKIIILGVAGEWSRRKGLKEFLKLARMIENNNKIVLVGLNKKQLKELPDSIIGIGRTNSVKELAEIYSMADVFFNPTYEDNFPTVNIEALACGTPVVTYNTGGSGECLDDDCGEIVEQGDLRGVIELLKNTKYDKRKCEEKGKKYDKMILFKEYMNVYHKDERYE